MNPIAMLDPEVTVQEGDDQYTIHIEAKFGQATIYVDTWIAEIAADQIREKIASITEGVSDD